MILSAIRANPWYVRSKIAWKNIAHPVGTIFQPAQTFIPYIDAAKKVIGLVDRSAAHENGLLHPSVHLILFRGVQSSDLRVLLHLRLDNGKIAQSAKGHVELPALNLGLHLLGEMVRQNMKREGKEEIGLLDLSPFLIGEYPYHSDKGKNQELTFLHGTHYQGEQLLPDPKEVRWLGWFSLKGTIKLMMKQPERFSSSLLWDMEYLLDTRNPFVPSRLQNGRLARRFIAFMKSYKNSTNW